MCCCESPNVNGQPGYRWQPTDKPITRPVDPPPLADLDQLLFDAPGRCGGVDSHSHHFRVVGGGSLLWRHGGGHGRCRIAGWPMVRAVLTGLEDNARYWMLHALYQAYSEGHEVGTSATAGRWQRAAIEKRIKLKRRGGVVVWARIEPPSA